MSGEEARDARCSKLFSLLWTAWEDRDPVLAGMSREECAIAFLDNAAQQMDMLGMDAAEAEGMFADVFDRRVTQPRKKCRAILAKLKAKKAAES